MITPFVLMIWTCATEDEARQICQALLEKRWIACANLIPHVESIYLWENHVTVGKETKVFIKTLDSHFVKVRDYIQQCCSYDIPEISKIIIDEVNSNYLEWITNTVCDI